MTLGDAYRALGALADEVGSDEPCLREIERTVATLRAEQHRRDMWAGMLEGIADAYGDGQPIVTTRRECARILREVES